ncbi:MAG: Hsp20/alpha crystallin family protein [Deltaproteobacteria bacterium]|nr:Hsp20/alpha crystallin family protein [Deltaproteobacteria bacterium]
MAEKTVAASPKPQSPAAKESTRSQERHIVPPVDIYETNEGLVVLADLPGVSQEGLDVRVENSMLTIHATPRHAAPGDPIYREYELVSFFRQFELSDKVDQNKISAVLKHGVLTLNLPKAEEAKPRKIEVRVN